MSKIEHGLKLDDAQKDALMEAMEGGASVKLTLKPDQLIGQDVLKLTKAQLTRLANAHQKGKGMKLTLTAPQMRVQDGGRFGRVGRVVSAPARATKAAVRTAPAAVEAVKPYAGFALRAGVPIATERAGSALGSRLGPQGAVLGSLVGAEIGKRATRKETLGFGIGKITKSEKERLDSLLSDLEGAGLGSKVKKAAKKAHKEAFETMLAIDKQQGGAKSGKGFKTAGKGFRSSGSGLKSGNDLSAAQAYLRAVAEPTSVDGRPGKCKHCGC